VKVRVISWIQWCHSLAFSNSHKNVLIARLIATILLVVAGSALGDGNAQTSPRRLSLAVLDFGDSTLGRRTADMFAVNFKRENGLAILDRDQVRTAARGAGYAGAISMSVDEARDLGAALGCDFFILGEAQTLRRSPSSGPIYFESYASIFVVSARTGRLIRWERPNFRAATAVAAEQALLAQLSAVDLSYIDSIRRAQEDERRRGRSAVAAALSPLDSAVSGNSSACGSRSDG
jgi:hypothetical protein